MEFGTPLEDAERRDLTIMPYFTMSTKIKLKILPKEELRI